MTNPHLNLSAIAPDQPATLGPADLAVLTRLRTIALLFDAVGAAVPDLQNIVINLSVDPQDRLHWLSFLTMRSSLFIARTMEWHDLISPDSDRGVLAADCDTIEARLTATECACPPALLRLLLQIRLHPMHISAADDAFLTRARWRIHPAGRNILPILSQRPSAHEALELVLAAEESGGLGTGPLARLAGVASAHLIRGGGR